MYVGAKLRTPDDTDIELTINISVGEAKRLGQQVRRGETLSYPLKGLLNTLEHCIKEAEERFGFLVDGEDAEQGEPDREGRAG